MAQNSIVGVIQQIGETQNLVSKNNGTSYKKRDLLLMVRKYDPNTGEPITDNENTPLLSFMGEKCSDLDKFQPGQTVTVYFELQGRKYTDQAGISKIINDIRPYRIELYQTRQQSPRQQQQPQPQNGMMQGQGNMMQGQGGMMQGQGNGQQQNFGQQNNYPPQNPGFPQQGGGYEPPF